MNVLLGVSGSIAAKLTLKLQIALEKAGHEIETVVTKSAMRIGGECDWRMFHEDEDEWRVYENEERVLHIDLVKWADLFLIAPITANTISKIRYGLSDNLLTSCALAWNHVKPMLVAPAMNTQMWENLELSYWQDEMDFVVIPPQEKTLYCGDTGLGAMANIEDIVRVVNQYLPETT